MKVQRKKKLNECSFLSLVRGLNNLSNLMQKVLIKTELNKLEYLLFKCSQTSHHIKYLGRIIMNEKIQFVSMDELSTWINEWMKSFNDRYDVIIGVPRSGLYVACRIALALGKPLSTPELFVQDLTWQSESINSIGARKVLLVEDSVETGKTLEDAYNLISAIKKDVIVHKTALIASENARSFVDNYYKIIPQPRLFEWNLMHAKRGKLASDMDGVLCENCPKGVDLNERQYERWIKRAKPYRIPSFNIDTIVSNRLEKYRKDTEEWLQNNNVNYNELILWNLPSKKDRHGMQAERKAKEILRINPDIVWESSYVEAKKIWEVTRIPTICFDNMVIFS